MNTDFLDFTQNTFIKEATLEYYPQLVKFDQDFG